MSTVLIIGASRGLGLETVKLALKAGHSVGAEFLKSEGERVQREIVNYAHLTETPTALWLASSGMDCAFWCGLSANFTSTRLRRALRVDPRACRSMRGAKCRLDYGLDCGQCGRIALTNGDCRALIGQIVLRAKQSNAALCAP